MTISSAVNKVQISSGSTITITNLEAQNTGQVLVTKTNSAGVESTLVITTDYTIDTGITTVTLNVALAVGETATASLNVPNTQGTDYKNASPFNAETAEDAFDKLTLKNKQQQEELDRSVKFVISETSSSNIEIPDVSGNSDKYLKLNSGETAFEWSTLSTSSGLGNIVEDTSPQLGGDLDTNSFNIQFDTAHGIQDDSGNEQLSFTKVASAVNHVDIQNAATSGLPVISAAGTDTNVDLKIHGKNTGNVILSDGTDITKELSVELSGATTAKTATLTSAHTDNRTITLPDATDTLVGKATTDTLTNKTIVAANNTLTIASTDLSDTADLTYNADTDVSGNSWVLDEDDLTSDSATKVPTQQSVKAYVDGRPGKIVQIVNVQDGAVATGTTTIPEDDTIPQNTEGDEYMTLAITPTSSSNKLKIDVVIFIGHSASSSPKHAALFQDSTANALATGSHFESTAGGATPVVFSHYMTAGTTSSTTFKVRAGSNLAGTTTFNGLSGSRLFGGSYASSITITEIEV